MDRPSIPELEPIKPNEAAKAYSFNWEIELGSETIASSSWLVQGDLPMAAASFTPTETIISLDPGKVGGRNLVKNIITTSGGQTLTKSAAIRTVEYS